MGAIRTFGARFRGSFRGRFVSGLSVFGGWFRWVVAPFGDVSPMWLRFGRLRFGRCVSAWSVSSHLSARM